MPKKLTPQEKFDKSKLDTIKMQEEFDDILHSNIKECFILPMYLRDIKKTKPDSTLAMNMNSYLHRHVFKVNAIKKEYHEIVWKQVKWLKIKWQFKLLYKIYWKHKCDWANVYSIVDKFFCDALQEHWCIEDDGIDTIISGTWENGWKVKSPYIEVYIINQ